MHSPGHLLRLHREARGLTQAYVAAKLKLTQGHVSALERGTRDPSLETLRAFADLYTLDDEARTALGAAALHPVQAAA